MLLRPLPAETEALRVHSAIAVANPEREFVGLFSVLRRSDDVDPGVLGGFVIKEAFFDNLLRTVIENNWITGRDFRPSEPGRPCK